MKCFVSVFLVLFSLNTLLAQDDYENSNDYGDYDNAQEFQPQDVEPEPYQNSLTNALTEDSYQGNGPADEGYDDYENDYSNDYDSESNHVD